MAAKTEKNEDSLFLLEVLIDKISFEKSPCFSDRDFRTCVKITCPSVEPLEVCDDDPGSTVAKSGGPFVKTFNTGKSTLFFMSHAEVSKAMSSFPVKLLVYKSLPCGCLPTKINMGEATIDMTKEFVQAYKKHQEDPTSQSCEGLQDTFHIFDPNKAETGQVAMFLRISCFGKSIVTKFQGGGGPAMLGSAGAGASFADRSCAPRKQFQTRDDPCACGVGQAALKSGADSSCKAPCRPGSQIKGSGYCPPVPDPWDSMPCENPDDPCFCTGPKPAKPDKMVCKNTHQYCMHVPKGALTSLQCCQDLVADEIMDVESTDIMKKLQKENSINFYKTSSIISYETVLTNDEYFDFPERLFSSDSSETELGLLDMALWSGKKRSVSFSDTVNCGFKLNNFSTYSLLEPFTPNNIFGKAEIVYTLFNEFCSRQSSGTQATASLNKCLQVNSPYTITNYSSYKMIRRDFPEQSICPDIYFFGRKKNQKKIDLMGMGCSGVDTKPHKELQRDVGIQGSSVDCYTSMEERGKTKLYKEYPRHRHRARGRQESDSSSPTGSPTNAKSKSHKDERQGSRSVSISPSISNGTSVQAKSPSCNTGQQTKCCNSKAVTITNDSCCGNAEMGATVSHVRIAPRDPCPSEGFSPCIGPKCLTAISGQDGQDSGPVKVTSVSNPRRGVFEIVIRKITDAPLAKNELMLEWTPPPTRSPGGFCDLPCLPLCRPPRCKGPKCRRSCWSKFCRKCCRKPCGPPCWRPCKKPCGRSCARPCGRPCGRVCGRPCGRSCGRPCLRPCRKPCGYLPCGSPCSSPCRMPCGPFPCPPYPCKRPCYTPSCFPVCRTACRTLCRYPCRAPCRSPCRGSPCRSPCDSPCKTGSASPCDTPCKKECSPSPCPSPPCVSACGSPCKAACNSPCKQPCKNSCVPACNPVCSPCKRPCRSPCKRPCRSPCKRPCRSPCKRPCRSPCKRPCSPPCRSPPCRPCPSCRPCRPTCKRVCKLPCKTPCRRRCRPRPTCIIPSRLACRECCLPCAPSPCKALCDLTYCVNLCKVYCTSTPCLRPCPVAYKKPRKYCSQPRIKPHKKYISPCYNRAHPCSIARCYSGPCFKQCRSVPCPPRSCSMAHVCPSEALCPDYPPCVTQPCYTSCPFEVGNCKTKCPKSC